MGFHCVLCLVSDQIHWLHESMSQGDSEPGCAQAGCQDIGVQ